MLDILHRFYECTARTPTYLAGYRNVLPVVIAPEVLRVPVTLMLGMMAWIEAAGNNLSTCGLTKEKLLVGSIQVRRNDHT